MVITLYRVSASGSKPTRKHSSRMPNHPLANHTCFIMNKFEHSVQWHPSWTRLTMFKGSLPVQWGLMLGGGTMGWGPPWWSPMHCHKGPLMNRQTKTTENITFLQLRWRVVKNLNVFSLEIRIPAARRIPVHTRWRQRVSSLPGIMSFSRWFSRYLQR